MKLNGKSINYNVQTVDELVSLDGLEGDIVVVTDENRGGVFVYREDNVGTNNEGTIFNGWTRQYDGAVNVKWFGAKGDGVTDDTTAIQNALDLGGNIYIPTGIYKIAITIDIDNTVIFGEGVGKTILRAIDGGRDVPSIINSYADNVIIHDLELNGQSVQYELSNPTYANAQHCIKIWGVNNHLYNLETYHARGEGVCVRTQDSNDISNTLIENLYSHSNARNSASVINGKYITFRNCRFQLDNTMEAWETVSTPDDVHLNGLYLFDCEVGGTENIQYIYLENNEFNNDGIKTANYQVVFQFQNEENFHVYINNCRFFNSFLKPLSDTNIVHYFNVSNCYFNFSVFNYFVEDGIYTFKNSSFVNIEAGENTGVGYSIFRDAILSDNTILFNVKDNSPDNLVKSNKIYDAVSVNSNILTNGTAYKKTFIKQISVTDTVNWTDVVLLGTRGSFKITVAGSDNSVSSLYAEFFSESFMSANDNYAYNQPPTIYLNDGTSIQWKGQGQGTTSNFRTLQMKAKASTANEFIVTVEVFTKYETFSTVTFLI